MLSVDGAGDTPGWMAWPVFSLLKTRGGVVCAVAAIESAKLRVINAVLFLIIGFRLYYNMD